MAEIKLTDIGSNTENPIQWAKFYIQEHISSELNMAVIANELNLSYTYFSKLFRQEIGKSFSAYVAEIKMQRAGEMLKSGTSIAEISE